MGASARGARRRLSADVRHDRRQWSCECWAECVDARDRFNRRGMLAACVEMMMEKELEERAAFQAKLMIGDMVLQLARQAAEIELLKQTQRIVVPSAPDH